jgi:nitrite reductase (NO-forming)
MSALLPDGAVNANVGERARLFVGNGGPKLISSFRLIAEIFDPVYGEGAVGGGALTRTVQTTLIPTGARGDLRDAGADTGSVSACG